MDCFSDSDLAILVIQTFGLVGSLQRFLSQLRPMLCSDHSVKYLQQQQQQV